MPKQKNVLKYQSIDRTARWNYCQLVAKYIFDSSVSDEQLKIILLEMQTGQYRLTINIE
jgi:hypothetical protein